MKINIISIYSLLFFVFFGYAQNQNKWIEDIDFYQKTLEEKHINLFHSISKNEFNSEIKNLKNKVHKLTGFQTITELMRITQKIGGGKGDGHTAVPLWNRNLHKFPLKLFNFDGELRVISIVNKHQKYFGNKLINIDGIPINDIYEKVAKLTPFTENEQSSKDRTSSYLVVSEILKALNITKKLNEAKFTFEDEKGNKEKILLKSYNKKLLTSFKYQTAKLTIPNISRPKESKLNNLWFTSLNKSKTIYINFKEYPSEKEMNVFSEDVYTYIQKHKSKHLIIDLRDNYGGDFYKGLLLSAWLNTCNSIDWKSKVYVLVNRKTYSAAMVNALQFKQILNAKIIGEPTGANPNGYQDMGQFLLPNSKLLITHTKRLFRFQDTNSKGLQPDYFITSKWKNFKNGFDEVFNWVLQDLNKK